jgi:Integrase core domain
MAEVHTAEGRLYLFVAIERASTFAVAERHAKATRRIAANFLRALIATVPYTIYTVLTDNGTPFTELTRFRTGADQQEEVQHPEGLYLIHAFDYACEQHGIEHRLTKPGHPWLCLKDGGCLINRGVASKVARPPGQEGRYWRSRRAAEDSPWPSTLSGRQTHICRGRQVAQI